MTYFLSLRNQTVGGGVEDPRVLMGNGWSADPRAKILPWDSVRSLTAGRNLVFAVHGFNVSQPKAMRTFSRLEAALGLPASDVFLGVLWPGDFWIPAINYPFESATANDCGRRIAQCCDTQFADAASITFFSHSLGARVVLSTIRHLKRTVKFACLTAGAVDRDCFLNEFSVAAENVERLTILASRRDKVLKIAFSVGDFVADLLDGDDKFFTAALGYKGPARPTPGNLAGPWQIAESDRYDHGDYFPSSDYTGAAPPPMDVRPQRVVQFFQTGRAGGQGGWP